MSKIKHDRVDMVDLARFVVEHLSDPARTADETARIESLYRNGGRYFEGLFNDIERRAPIGKSFALMVRTAVDKMRSGSDPGTITMNRFDKMRYLKHILTNGYDPKRASSEMELDGIGDAFEGLLNLRYATSGAYFFKDVLNDDIDQSEVGFIEYGLPNIQKGVVASIQHEVPMDLFLLFLLASAGEAYMSSLETAIWNGATRLFDTMLRGPKVETRIVIHSFPDTATARRVVESILNSGTAVYFITGKLIFSGKDEDIDLHRVADAYVKLFDENSDQSFEDQAVMVINSTNDLPRNGVGTDELSEEEFLYVMLHFKADSAQHIFASMVEENEDMAKRASTFYASIPGHSLEVLRSWREEWTSPSPRLARFVDDTVQRGEDILNRYFGRTFTPGAGLDSERGGASTPGMRGAPCSYMLPQAIAGMGMMQMGAQVALFGPTLGMRMPLNMSMPIIAM